MIVSTDQQAFSVTIMVKVRNTVIIGYPPTNINTELELDIIGFVHMQYLFATCKSTKIPDTFHCLNVSLKIVGIFMQRYCFKHDDFTSMM